MQASINDLQRFGRTIKLKAFQPFTTAENALENINAISEHMMTEDLKVGFPSRLVVRSLAAIALEPDHGYFFLLWTTQNFLEANLPKAGKKGGKFVLGVVSVPFSWSD